MTKSNSDLGGIELKDKLEYNEVPFMHYGIINRFNFSMDKINYIPIKRWDPLAFNYSVNKNYSIYSYIYGHYSYVSAIRGKRPFSNRDNKEAKTQSSGHENHLKYHYIDYYCKDFKIENEAEKEGSNKPVDIFEPMLNGKHYIVKSSGAEEGTIYQSQNEEQKVFPAYSIIVADEDKKVDSPFSAQPRVYEGLKGRAITMINKFPAMARIIDESLMSRINNLMEKRDINAKIAKGICFVSMPRKFYQRVQDIPIDEFTALFISMQKAIQYTIYELIKKEYLSATISPFFNIGPLAGGSQKRIHSQVYIDLNQDGHGLRMENFLKRFEKLDELKYCHLCKTKHENRNRLIYENDTWELFASGSPIRNYHLRFAPKRHINHFGQIRRNEFRDLAEILILTFKALDNLGVNSNRNIIFNTPPWGYRTNFHIFGDILPHEYIGGAEMADDMRVARILPNETAKILKQEIKELKANS